MGPDLESNRHSPACHSTTSVPPDPPGVLNNWDLADTQKRKLQRGRHLLLPSLQGCQVCRSQLVRQWTWEKPRGTLNQRLLLRPSVQPHAPCRTPVFPPHWSPHCCLPTTSWRLHGEGPGGRPAWPLGVPLREVTTPVREGGRERSQGKPNLL